MALKKRKLGIPESAKRPKAQRKFAQGQVVPSTSYSYNCSSVNTTPPVNNNVNTEPPPEVFPNRPNTEDFLTYLCYRGTPSIPTNLDFVKSTATAAAAAAQKSKNENKKSPGRKKINMQSPAKSTSAEATVSPNSSSKRKENNATQQETAPPVKSKKKNNEDSNNSNSAINPPPVINKSSKNKVSKSPITVISPKVLRGKKAETNTSRRSLRARTNISMVDYDDSIDRDIDEEERYENEDDSNVKLSNNSTKINDKNKKKINDVQVQEKNEETPLKNEEVITKPASKPGRPRKNLQLSPEKVVTKTETKNIANYKEKLSKLNTPEVNEHTPTKPTRNKKTKKAENTVPLASTPEKEDAIDSLEKDDDDDGSEDIPLKPKTIKKSENITTKVVEVEKTVESNITLPTDSKETAPPKRGRGRAKKINLQPVVQVEKVESVNEASTNGLIKPSKLKPPSDHNVEVKEIENKKDKKITKRKKKLIEDDESPVKEIKFKTLEKTEEKPESGRPQRKTKEAAAIYMELIGHKLNSEHYEEDGSTESFPDLPNVKETEKLELEMKLNTKTKIIPKKSEKIEFKSSEKLEKIYTFPPNETVEIEKSSKKLKKIKSLKIKRKLSEQDGSDGIISKKKIFSKKGLKKCRKRKLKKIKKHITGDTDRESEADMVEIKKVHRMEEVKQIEEEEPVVQNTFSESDDEPLAAKICKASESQPDSAQQQKSPIPRISFIQENSKSSKVSNDIVEPPVKNVFAISKEQNNHQLPSPPPPPPPPQQTHFNQNLHSEDTILKKPIMPLATTSSPFSNNKADLSKSLDHNGFSSKFPSFPPKPSNLGLGMSSLTQTTRHHTSPLETYPSAAVNPTFLTPKFEGNTNADVGLRTSIATGETNSRNLNFSKTLKNESKNSLQSSSLRNQDETVPTTASFGFKNSSLASTTPPTTAFATNLMPSKEESGKIFGIASVSLAQSSGPDNTKCTLGKCGSIHKPTLGPVVPTESYLGEHLLSSKERRKAKVNMTHEQIHKWLIECSSNPDEIQDDLDDDFEELYKNNPISTPSPTLSKAEKESTLFNSKKEKDPAISSFTKNENSWSGKGPSLKAVPVVASNDKELFKTNETPTDNKKQNLFTLCSEPIKLNIEEETEKPKKDKKDETKEVSPKIVAEQTAPQKPQGKGNKKKQEKEKNKNVVEKKIPVDTPSTKTNRKAAGSPPPQSTPPVSLPSQSAQTTNTSKKYSPIQNKTRQTSSTKEQNRLKVFSNTFKNSDEQEKSVYTFDKEDDVLPPIARTFRQQQAKKESDTEKTEPEKIESKPEPKQRRNKNVDTSNSNVGEDVVKKGTINLSVNKLKDEESISPIETNKNKKTTKARRKSTMNEFILNDSEGETFYIPIQGTGLSATAGSNKSDLVQAVEVKVKVGREGPDGPNQRVSVQATLVTKPNLAKSITPPVVSAISSPVNVEVEEKKSSSKSAAQAAAASKSVPIGTVTPRFKSDGSSGNSGLKRVNSNSSLLSGSNKSKSKKPSTSVVKKRKTNIPIKMYNNTAFPHRDDPAQMVEAPVFRPTDKEFHDPMEFIERITPIAARFGICKIIPPISFKPECRVSDEMRFSAYNQYVHKMLYRWGPNVKELNAIKKHCQTQRVSLTPFPLIGQMQVDLPRLYHTVQELGGLQEVMEKKKWNRVADEMCIPKLAQDRATRLDDIYCKYLLPYDTLSTSERQKLFDEVESDRAKCEARARRTADFLINSENNSFEENFNEPSDDSEEEADGVSMECIEKGKSMPLKQFVRIARNTCSLWFKNVEPTSPEVESEFWRHVAVRDSHVCVHSGSIDSSGWGYGFPSPGPKGKGSHCARHPWNLKVLTNNPGSVLRSLGPVMGVTVPTLHVGMLFSACCWYRDPHGLSWIEYLHTGASKIWYGIPDDQSSNFRSALQTLIPSHCQNKNIWLPCDTVMVPPHMLTDRGVSLCRTEQKPGEFVVIFPRSYTSSISTGYVVSESVYFATATWLESAKEDFKDIHDSCEPALFSLEQLLFSISSDQRVSKEVLEQCLPMLEEVFEKENEARSQIENCGVNSFEKISQDKGKNKKKVVNIEEDNECDICRANLYISVVKSNDKNNTYCLEHALKYIQKEKLSSDQCTLVYSYSIEEIKELIQKVRTRLDQKKY